jgi:hypothetical protein
MLLLPEAQTGKDWEPSGNRRLLNIEVLALFYYLNGYLALQCGVLLFRQCAIRYTKE